jgi:hypothetical protein
VLPNQGNNVSSMEECRQQAIDGNYNVFGLQYYGQCWMGTDYNRGVSLGQRYDDCGPLGTSWANQTYINMPPPSSVNGYTYLGCYNDNSSRMIPNQQQNVTSIEECAQIAQNLGQSVFGVQDNYACFTGNDENRAMALGSNTDYNACGPLGGSWTNLVYANPSSSCSYKMNSSELTCYADNNPDLASSGITTPTQLQNHWSTIGCKESRNNQCPSYQQSSGTYNYKGCYNTNTNTGMQPIPNNQGTVQTIDECQTIASQKKDIVFGLNNKGTCYTGNNEQEAYQYGLNVNKKYCSALGGATTNQVYVSTKPFQPPGPAKPILNSSNFNETFTNINEDTDRKRHFILLLILLMFAFLFYYIFTSSKNNKK